MENFAASPGESTGQPPAMLGLSPHARSLQPTWGLFHCTDKPSISSSPVSVARGSLFQSATINICLILKPLAHNTVLANPTSEATWRNQQKSLRLG
jgi:hypothetical protein